MWPGQLNFLLGAWILAIAGLQCAPLLIAMAEAEVAARGAFLASTALCALIGGGLMLGFRGSERRRVPFTALALPIMAVVAGGLMAGLPFFFLRPQLGLAPAWFEGISHLTTTGLSAYGPEMRSASLIFWRAQMGWLGGFAAIILTLSLLTAANSGAMQLHRSPLPFGDSRQGYDRLWSTSRAILPLYGAVTVGIFLAISLAGSSPFDAVILSFSAVSTTGVQPPSGALSLSAGGKLVLLMAMMLACFNWDFLLDRWQRGWRTGFFDIESRSLIGLTLLAAALLSVIVPPAGLSAVIDRLFLAVSAVSTTGLAIPDNKGVEGYLPAGILLIFLALFGGSVASSAGGLKHLRLIVLWKQGLAELNRLAHPSGLHVIKVGASTVAKGDLGRVWFLVSLYLLSVAAGAIAVSALGIGFRDALEMSFATVTLSGPLIFTIDPAVTGFQGLGSADYGIFSILMVAGRVEASVLAAFILKLLWPARY